MTLLSIQIVTGIGLALVYVPSADKAYESLLYLNNEQPLGGLLRAMHYYAGSGMVVMVLAAHDPGLPPRGLQVSEGADLGVGVLLLLCTLGMFFSGPDPPLGPGRLLGPGRRPARWPGRVPVVGPQVVRLVLGGPVIGGDSLSRFFTLHVFVIPGCSCALPGRSPLAGAEARDQRAAGPGTGGRSQDL